jgi:hypothetical protein
MKKELLPSIMITGICLSLVLVLLLYVSAKPHTKTIVYACPETANGSCFRVLADVSKDEGYWMVDTIYFDSGSIDFWSCSFSRGEKNGVCSEVYPPAEKCFDKIINGGNGDIKDCVDLSYKGKNWFLDITKEKVIVDD